MATAGTSLGTLIWEATERFSDKIALDVDDKRLTYLQLVQLANRLGRVLVEVDRPRPLLGAVFAMRSEVAYAGILGTLLSGAGYVPLNPKFPAQRNAHMLHVSGSRTLIVGAECIAMLDSLLTCVTNSLVILVPTVDDTDELVRRHPMHRFIGAGEIRGAQQLTSPPTVDTAEIAYLLFTSGSTGAPKGVMVSHANVLPFLDAVQRRYEITCEDRFSQTFDLTFDLSVFDMFACWSQGASLHCVPERQLMLPDEFVRSHELTVWFSVPSLGMMLRSLRRLTPNAFPSLRWSLFCGERLPVEVAQAWQIAAPTSIVENLYGPTEATIACTLYRWNDTSKDESVSSTVPIGIPFAGMTTAIVDEQLGLLGPDAKGELCVKGPQVTPGYWQDLEQTSARFVAMPWHGGPDNRWYRTGDIAYINHDGNLIHCGRNDDQIKIRGYRIELSEIEHVVRRVAGTDFVVVLAHPNERGTIGLTAVVTGNAVGADDILTLAAESLPEYMVPGRVMFVTEMPLNANGKIDRKAVLALIEQGRT